MMYNIAVAGKGGTGKTTFIALVIKALIIKNLKPILAIDADPNINLPQILGITYEESIADIIDETKERLDNLPAGMTKERYIEYRLEDCLKESSGFDLLIMGRPEGPGCYCYANTILRGHIDKLSKNYSYVIMDNEAGMEHLSRKTTRNVDYLFIVSDPSLIGLKSALRIYNLVLELKIKVVKCGLIVNYYNGSLADFPNLKESGLPLCGKIPHDQDILDLAIKGEDIFKLNSNSKAFLEVQNILEEQVFKIQLNS
ncbi:MAG: AAA family ATPase [Armatimonadetes bacterium]|nr:AAA family ATPase [Armatimonadota bacterium]